MLRNLRNALKVFMVSVATGATAFVTTAGCDTSNGSFTFFRDDDEDYYYDDYYDDDFYYEEVYYVDDCGYYDDCW